MHLLCSAVSCCVVLCRAVSCQCTGCGLTAGGAPRQVEALRTSSLSAEISAVHAEIERIDSPGHSGAWACNRIHSCQ